MTTFTLGGDAPHPTALARLRADDPVLTAFGLACLLTGAVTLALPLSMGGSSMAPSSGRSPRSSSFRSVYTP